MKRVLFVAMYELEIISSAVEQIRSNPDSYFLGWTAYSDDDIYNVIQEDFVGFTDDYAAEIGQTITD